MSVLMVGVDESTKGGMWTVVENYLYAEEFVKCNELVYIPTAITGCAVRKRLLFSLKAYLKIMSAYRKTNFSVLHVHMSERASIWRKGLIMKYAKKQGSKIVLHMHGAEFEVLYRAMNDRTQKSVRNIVNLADRIIILGEYWKEFMSSLVDDPGKVCVVYNAVKVPETNKYDVSSRNVLFLGAVSKRKGIDTLLEALRKSNDVLKDKCRVTIYGPDVEGNIEERIRENGLSAWVIYCGWLDKAEKSRVLESTAVNVLPSFNEGLPMTILEAMSYGVPSVTTSVAAIPEAVNSSNGIVLEPGDADALSEAIAAMITDPEKRMRLSRQCFDDAKKKFSVETHLNKVQLIYDGLDN